MEKTPNVGVKFIKIPLSVVKHIVLADMVGSELFALAAIHSVLIWRIVIRLEAIPSPKLLVIDNLVIQKVIKVLCFGQNLVLQIRECCFIAIEAIPVVFLEVEKPFYLASNIRCVAENCFHNVRF